MKRSFLSLVAIITTIIGSYGAAYALPGYLATFNSTYSTSGTVLDSCLLCHTGYPTVKTNLNSYSVSYRDNGHNFKAIELFDSDGDGGTNIAEINAKTFPGDTASKIAVVTPSNTTQTLMQLATGQHIFTNNPIAVSPVLSDVPANAMPFGFDPATGVRVAIGTLTAPADIYIGMIMPSDPSNLYMVWPDNTIQPIANGFPKFIANTSGGFDMPLISNSTLSGMQSGAYSFGLLLTNANSVNFGNYFIWMGGVNITPPGTTASAEGANLYAQNCAACHGSLASSNKKGKSASQIQGAINSGIGGMGGLSSLTSAQVQAIANALATTTTNPTTATTPTAASTEGANLYAQNCAACHGSLASSNKKGKSASQIQGAINSGVGNMGGLTNLTSAQVQAIANALATTSGAAPTGGAALYAQNCSSCHGNITNARSSWTASKIQSAINSGKGGMGYLRSLTSAQVQAIAGACAQYGRGTGGGGDDGGSEHGGGDDGGSEHGGGDDGGSDGSGESKSDHK